MKYFRYQAKKMPKEIKKLHHRKSALDHTLSRQKVIYILGINRI